MSIYLFCCFCLLHLHEVVAVVHLAPVEPLRRDVLPQRVAEAGGARGLATLRSETYGRRKLFCID